MICNPFQVTAGHLVLFKQPRENADNAPAVFNLMSIPWGGRLPIENSVRLPNDAFHFSKLLLGRDCLYVVAKNAHITWTKGQVKENNLFAPQSLKFSRTIGYHVNEH